MENAELKVEYIPVGDLKQYSGNAKRHPKKQVAEIRESIEQFGFNDPIAIWRNNEIIEGHGRLLAALEMGMDKVPVIRLDSLTDEERRAYVLAHNQTTLSSGWDEKKLRAEIQNLPTIDMEKFGFNVEALTAPEIDYGYYGDERERTYKSVNFDMFDDRRAEGWFEMPRIKPVDYVPKKLIGFNYAKTSEEYDACVHFYLDDYQFERIWNEPEKYIEILRKFDAVMTPNFSIYYDYPECAKIWNTYRARLLGQAMQDAGLTVIPIVYWSTEKSYEYCFDGLPENGTLSINNIGNRAEESKRLWNAGVDELIARKKPKRIILYGNGVMPDYDFGNVEVICFTNSVIERMKGADNERDK